MCPRIFPDFSGFRSQAADTRLFVHPLTPAHWEQFGELERGAAPGKKEAELEADWNAKHQAIMEVRQKTVDTQTKVFAAMIGGTLAGAALGGALETAGGGLGDPPGGGPPDLGNPPPEAPAQPAPAGAQAPTVQPTAPDATAGRQTFRSLLTESEQADFEALRARHPEWMPREGLDAPATVRSVEENAEARAEFTGRGHHPHPLKFGGEPNPPDLVPTGETRTEKNPTHTEITNFWNRVLRRINSQQTGQ